jgi:hypothetical protein
MPVIRFGGEGNGGVSWEWRGGSVVLFLGDEGTPGRCACALEAAPASAPRLLEQEEAGRDPRSSERRGWRRAGSAGGQGPVGREAGGWAWEKEAAEVRRRGSGPVVGHMGQAEKGRRPGRNRCSTEIQGSKRKSIFN